MKLLPWNVGGVNNIYAYAGVALYWIDWSCLFKKCSKCWRIKSVFFRKYAKMYLRHLTFYNMFTNREQFCFTRPARKIWKWLILLECKNQDSISSATCVWIYSFHRYSRKYIVFTDTQEKCINIHLDESSKNYKKYSFFALLNLSLRNTNFINLHKNCIFGNFWNIWQNTFSKFKVSFRPCDIDCR